MTDQRRFLLILLSLATVYVIWSSTYLAIKFAIAGFPPLLMSGLRNLIAGLILFALLRLFKAPFPTRQEWRGAAIVSSFLLLGGTGLVAVAEKWVGSGVASINIAIIPLLACLFSVLAGEKRTLPEWTGVIVGLLGILILNMSQEMSSNFPGNIILACAPVLWAIGSVISRHITLSKGLMASAAEMLAGGVITVAAGVLIGERITQMPSPLALGGFWYLTLFGSLVAFSAFTYLINNTSPALATSYAFVNPILAVLLGVVFAGEKAGGQVMLALGLVVIGVVFVVFGRPRRA